MSASLYMQLLCTNCSFAAHCGPEEMAEWLRASGMARRTRGLSPELLTELFRSASGSFRCPECNAPGMQAHPADEELDDEAWGMVRACERCRRPISAERLELLPDTRLCAQCARAGEAPQDEPEHCPHCGALMRMSQSRAGGVSRYVMRCSECGRTGPAQA